MRRTTSLVCHLLVGSAALAFVTPAAAQTSQEGAAQATNPTATTPAREVTNDGEIIVTATKRATTVQDVPFSVNAQSQQDLQRANAQTVEDISRNVAGLTVQNLGPGQSQVSVRGVSAGQIVRDQPGVKEQVGVYLDESVISLSLFTPDFDLFDLNRVETLRGPQGTLFGSGSVGGTLRYITNQPKLGKVEGLVEANANTVDESDVGGHVKAAVNVPLGATAAIRAVGYATHYAGFIDAVGPAAGKNINDGHRIGGRLSLLWEAAPGIRLTPRIVYQDVKANGFNRREEYHLYCNQFLTPACSLGGADQYLKLREQFRDKTTLADLTASADFGGAELTSVTSYIHRNILVSRDASALTGSVSVSPFIIALGAAPALANLPSNLRDTTRLNQWSQELRVASTGSGPFQWVFGGFYSHVNRKYAQRLPTPGYDAFVDAALGAGVSAAVANGFPLNSPYNADLPYIIKQAAVFGEASYKFGQFKLTGGGRYYDFKEKRDFISGGIFSNSDTRIGDKTKSNGFSPRAILSWEPQRRTAVNLQIAKGFRLGGVNDPLNIPLCSGGATGVDAQTYGGRPTYKDETLWNYEANFKLGGRGLSMTAAAFYNDIKNLQVTADAGSCSSRVVFNVPKAHSSGVELEINATPMPGLDLSLATNVQSAKFDSSVVTAGASPTVIAGIRDGNRLPTVPKFQLAATATYGQRFSSTGEWYVTGSFQHVGNRFTQPSDQETGAGNFNFIFFNPATAAFGTRNGSFGSLKLPSYDLVNASVGLKWDNGLEAVLYANNLFNKTPLLSLDRERGGRARLGYNVGQPRTIGLTVRKAF
ncbi:TonB-dependent receptor [Sphingomonas ginkgonis]|uniref:TonB-dependent receptor n=1 Tax=Sphingomonas ginkgonis TaxID=2315330 RepID=A0A3R9YNI5_9SPHN|nr:TonB-dependent receptor [Sphingomonas ginkgonis]RST31809.1 TonB-dependent receptor [Sphingomonas ginkgonis]